MAEIMTAHVRPWGNSHGIRITKEMMYVMNLKPNDSLQIIVEGDSIILKKAVNRKVEKVYIYITRLYMYLLLNVMIQYNR